MPEKEKAAGRANDLFEELALAWDALANANEAFIAVNAVGAEADVRAASRLVLRAMQQRSVAFTRALDAVLELTSE